MKYPVFRPNPSSDIAQKLYNAFLDGEVSGTYGQSINELNDFYTSTHSGYYAASCTSGTTALHLCCLALGVNSSSNVAVANVTNMASFYAPIYCGAKVYPVEVKEDTGLVCPEHIEILCQKISIDYLIIVHLYGQLCDISSILALSEKYNFKVIEDCAESHFASHNDKFAGSFFDASAFSFYANKIIWSGEGGLCLFKNFKDLQKANYLKSLGFSSDYKDPSRFYHKDIAYNYRLSNLSCLIALENSKKYKTLLDKRNEIAAIYNKLLSNKAFVYSLPSSKKNLKVYWVYFLEISQEYLNRFPSKHILFEKLHDYGIQCRDFFYPADQQPFLVEYARSSGYNLNPTHSNFENSINFYKRGIYLPFYESLNENDILYIVNSLEEVLHV